MKATGQASDKACWNAFEHQIWKKFNLYDLKKKNSFLLAVSGGLDSMVLLHVMVRLGIKSKIRVAHFHHGHSQNSEQQNYRDEVADFVKHKISSYSSLQIEYYYKSSENILQSEAEFREARWKFLRELRIKDEPILTAHHLDDWVETATLKMLRGTSLEGVTAFQEWNLEIFRPFLKISKDELKKYALDQNLTWLDDPSNSQTDYLRNWIREKWFVDLENKHPGAYHNFSKSLLQMVSEYQNNSTFELCFFNHDKNLGLDRMWFLSLSNADQLKAIALFLKKRQIYVFTQGQLQEIIKRLDKNQKDLTFQIIGRKWVINAMQIMLE